MTTLERSPETTITAKTSTELYDHLRSTGTGPDRLAIVERYMADNPECSAADVVEHLIAQHVQAGTVRKAGEFVHGSGFDVPGIGTVTTDESKRQREENATLRASLRATEARSASLLREVAELTRRNALLVEQVQSQRVRESEPKRRGKRELEMAETTNE